MTREIPLPRRREAEADYLRYWKRKQAEEVRRHALYGDD